MTRGSHAVVVFGAAVARDGTPSPALRERLRAALRVAGDDPDATLFVSGGAVLGRPPEGPVMARWLERHGVSRARIVVEPCARSTFENAAYVAPLVGRLGARRVTAVTQRRHGPRALFHLRAAVRRAGLAQPDIQLVAAAEPASVGPGRAALDAALETVKLVKDLSLWPWRSLLARVGAGVAARGRR